MRLGRVDTHCHADIMPSFCAQVAKLGGQLGRLLPELDSIYLFKFSQMYPMPPYTYV